MIHTKQKFPANSGGVLSKILILVAIAVAIIFGKPIGEKAVGLITKAMAEVKNFQSFPESAWASRELNEVTLEAPFTFGPGPDIKDKLPPAVLKMIAHYEMYVSDTKSRFLQASVARFEYAPGVQVNLEGAAQGAIKEIAAGLGDADPKFTITPGTLDGLVTRQATYFAQTRKSGPLHVDAIVIQKDQVIWQIQALYALDTAKADAERLLKSVHIKTTPAS